MFDWISGMFGGDDEASTGADSGGGFWSSVGDFFSSAGDSVVDFFSWDSSGETPAGELTGEAPDLVDSTDSTEVVTIKSAGVSTGQDDASWDKYIQQILGSQEGANAVGSLGKTLVYGLGMEDTAFGQGGLAGGEQVQQGGFGTFGIESLVAGITGWISGGSNLKRQENEREMMFMQYLDDMENLKEAQGYREGLQKAVIGNAGVRAGIGTAGIQERKMKREHKKQQDELSFASSKALDTHKGAAR